MTTSNQVPQVDFQQLLAMLRKPGVGPASLALLLTLLGLALPFVNVSTNLGMGMDQSGSINGFQAAGVAAWLTLIVAAAGVASWFVAQLAPFRLIIAAALVVLAVISIVIGLFFNPIAGELSQVNAAFSGLGAPGNMVSFGPHVGMLLLLLAAGASAFNAWKAR